MSLTKRRSETKAVRRSTSALHHPTVEPAGAGSGSGIYAPSGPVPRTPSSSDGESPSAVRRSRKLSQNKSRTWSPDEEQQGSTPFSSSSGNVKTAGLSTSPSKAKRASKIFRRIGGGSRIQLSASVDSMPSPPVSATPPLWLPLMDFLCRAVEQHGALKMGIFRLSANAKTVRELLQACVGLYTRKADEDAMARLFAPYAGEVDVAASVLKAYLREQSQPLIPIAFHDRFVSVPGMDDLEHRLEQLAQLVLELPEDLMHILERLIRSLHLVHANQEVNRMDASNLAIVFAPSLLREETEGLDIVKIRAQCQVIETFIVHHARIFAPPNQECSRSAPEEVVAAVSSEGEAEAEYVEEDERFALAVSQLTREAASEEDTEHAGKQAHRWRKETFNPFSPTPCQHCHKSIYGIRRKGYQCQDCDYPAHSSCRTLVGDTCPGHREGSSKVSAPRAVKVSAPLGQ